jgi:hypothetical protein
MKQQPHVISLLWVLLIIGACNKDEVAMPTPPAGLPAYTYPGEIFWAVPWNKTATGYEIVLNSKRLTQAAINKGVDVSVALWTEMTPFMQIPTTTYDLVQKDTINLSFAVKPDTLRVLAKAPFDITYESDVLIHYQ